MSYSLQHILEKETFEKPDLGYAEARNQNNERETEGNINGRYLFYGCSLFVLF